MGRARALTQVCKRLHGRGALEQCNLSPSHVERALLFVEGMMPMLLTLLMHATPSESSVSVGEVLFVAGEAGFAAVSAQPWMHRAADVATVSSVFSRFDVTLTTIPLLGPATTMLLEANLQEAGWQGRFVAGAASLSLQTLGCTLMALSWLDGDEVYEGPVAGARPTTVGFRIVDGGAGGVVTVSGVTF